MSRAYIAIGSNVGDRSANLNAAAAAVNALPLTKVTAASYIYETVPVDCPPCDNFYNAAIGVETELSPKALLGACLGIEAAMGRVRKMRNGPRSVDLDLLLYEGYSEATAELTVPHPRMYERSFVLVPLNDILKDAAVAEKISRLDTSGVKTTGARIKLP